MDLDSKMPWSRGRLRKLGEALVERRGIPEDCPSYDDVLLWHDDLAWEVRAIIKDRPWNSVSGTLDPTARSKTYHTLVQKLEREKATHLSLDKVQDLAGVRVDLDCSLAEQLALAKEILAHFGGEPSFIRDIRGRAHSGYRAVHVWLRLPAGRVEVQVRTLAQSDWANTYERLADLYGRGIRYGEVPEDRTARRMFDFMQRVSSDIAEMESAQQHLRDMQIDIDEQRKRNWYIPLADMDEFDQSVGVYREEADKYARFARDLELDQRALEAEAYDEGYDREGYDREGYDREGYDREGYDREGYDREGYDPDGDESEKYGDELDSYDRLELDQRAYERYERKAERLLQETRAKLKTLENALDAIEQVLGAVEDNR